MKRTNNPETGLLGGTTGDQPALAASLLVVSLFVLGLQDGLVKLVSSDISLWQFQALRSVVNLAVLIVVARIVWGTMPPSPKRYWAVALRSFLLVAAMVFFFGAVPVLSLAEIASGLYTFPLFVAILSFLVLKERVGPRRVVAIVAGFFGTLLIMKPGTDAFTFYTLMPVAAGLCYAGTVIITRKLCRDESPVTLAFGVAIAFVLVGGLGTGIFSVAPPTSLSETWPYLFTGWRPVGLGIIAIIGICAVLNVFSNMGMAKAYQSAEASWLAPFDYSYLVFATVWGFLLWGDLPDALSFLGMAVIAFSGAFVAWRERQENRDRRADFNRSLR